MNISTNLTKRVEELLSNANREPHWSPAEAAEYMELVQKRRQQFEKLASRLVETIIRPRLESLEQYFPNACPTNHIPLGQCAFWFGYCERFPVTVKIVFAVEHNARLDHIAVVFDAHMMPTFIKFDEHNRLTMPIDNVNDVEVADWVEQRLLEFLDAYLCIDRGSENFDEDVLTDPVCGMRMSRSSAAASANCCGHPYYFCSQDCHARFVRNPTEYVCATAVN